MAGTVHEDLDLVVLCEDEVVKVPSYGKPELFQLVRELLHPQISHEYSIFSLSVSLKLIQYFSFKISKLLPARDQVFAWWQVKCQ